jgi:hypothetical protein
MVFASGTMKESCTLVHTLVFLPGETIYPRTSEALFRGLGTRTSILQQAQNVK